MSDVARLWVLKEYGGVYLDTGVEVFKSMDALLEHSAFVGVEGSKKMPVGTCVIGTVPHGEWITEQCEAYSQTKHFIKENGEYDTTPNTIFLTENMCRNDNACFRNPSRSHYLNFPYLCR